MFTCVQAGKMKRTLASQNIHPSASLLQKKDPCQNTQSEALGSWWLKTAQGACASAATRWRGRGSLLSHWKAMGQGELSQPEPGSREDVQDRILHLEAPALCLLWTAMDRSSARASLPLSQSREGPAPLLPICRASNGRLVPTWRDPQASCCSSPYSDPPHSCSGRRPSWPSTCHAACPSSAGLQSYPPGMALFQGSTLGFSWVIDHSSCLPRKIHCHQGVLRDTALERKGHKFLRYKSQPCSTQATWGDPPIPFAKIQVSKLLVQLENSVVRGPLCSKWFRVL